MSKIQCAEIKLPENITCDCNYVRPTTAKLWIRKKKNGQVQVKINGKGKWINAEWDGTNLIRYFA